jgi:hypothetical protein
LHSPRKTDRQKSVTGHKGHGMTRKLPGQHIEIKEENIEITQGERHQAANKDGL